MNYTFRDFVASITPKTVLYMFEDDSIVTSNLFLRKEYLERLEEAVQELSQAAKQPCTIRSVQLAWGMDTYLYLVLSFETENNLDEVVARLRNYGFFAKFFLSQALMARIGLSTDISDAVRASKTPQWRKCRERYEPE
jgi:hypothetical protein